MLKGRTKTEYRDIGYRHSIVFRPSYYCNALLMRFLHFEGYALFGRNDQFLSSRAEPGGIGEAEQRSCYYTTMEQTGSTRQAGWSREISSTSI